MKSQTASQHTIVALLAALPDLKQVALCRSHECPDKWGLPVAALDRSDTLSHVAQRLRNRLLNATDGPAVMLGEVVNLNGWQVAIFTCDLSHYETSKLTLNSVACFADVKGQMSSHWPPGVVDACRSLVEHMHRNRLIMRMKAVDQRIALAATALCETFRSAGGTTQEGGWNHFLFRREPGIMGTAIAIRSLVACHYSVSSPMVHAALRHLRKCVELAAR